MQVFFTATVGRSGTTTLVEVFRRNILGSIAEHEPCCRLRGLQRVYRWLYPAYAQHLESRGFGLALQWADQDSPHSRRLVHLRARRIRQMKCEVYLESSHAFLSSLEEQYIKVFPQLRVVHLVRHPLEVATSSYNKRVRPTNDPEFLTRFSRWHPHPQARKNCLPAPMPEMTVIQTHFWAWIEAELRFVRFLSRHPEVPHFTLETAELSDPQRLAAMFDHFGLERSNGPIVVPPRQNQNQVKTVVTAQAREEARELLQHIDESVLNQLPNPFNLLAIRNTTR